MGRMSECRGQELLKEAVRLLEERAGEASGGNVMVVHKISILINYITTL